MYYSNILKQELSTANTYEHNLFDERYVDDRHRCHMAAKFGAFVDEDHTASFVRYSGYLSFIKIYKSRFIVHSNSCTTTELAIFFLAMLRLKTM